MDIGKNKIKKVVFDVNYPKQQGADQIQNKIISEFNTSIQDILDKKLSLFSESQFIKANKVEIDLGVLSIEQVENELSAMIEIELDTYFRTLQKQIEIGYFPDGIQAISYAEMVCDYLFNFFESGNIPWNLQEFGKSKDVVYWIEYLRNEKPELLSNVSKLFVKPSSRNRLLAVINTTNKRVVLSALFTPPVYKILDKIDSVLNNIFSGIKGHNTHRLKEISEQYILHYGLLLLESKVETFSASRLANEFFDFVLSDSSMKVSDILAPVIFQLNKKEILSKDEITFMKLVEKRYINMVEESNVLQFDVDDKKSLTQLNQKYFQRFIEINFNVYSKEINKLTKKLIVILSKTVSKDQQKELENIMYGIVSESLLSDQLELNSKLIFKAVSKKITSVFGAEIHSLVEESITKEELVFEQELIKLDPGKSADTVKQTENIYLSELILEDGNVNYRINIQKAVSYIELVANFGLLSLKSIFSKPEESIEEIINWIAEKHPRYLNLVRDKIDSKLTPLKLYQLDTALSEESYKKIVVSSSSAITSLGEVLFNEIIQESYIPSSYISEVGLDRLVNALKIFVRDSFEVAEQVLIKHHEVLHHGGIEYMQVLLDPEDNERILQFIEKENLLSSSTIHSMKSKTSLDEDVVKDGAESIDKLEKEALVSEIHDDTENIATEQDKKEIHTEKEIEISESDKSNTEEQKIDDEIKKLKYITKDLLKFHSLVEQLFANKINKPQTLELTDLIKKLIDSRNADLATSLVSMQKDKLNQIEAILPRDYKAKVESLLRVFKKKYTPEEDSNSDGLNTQKGESEDYKRLQEGESNYISNAGLIIVNPYITTLFSKLNLIEKKKFISYEKQVKAVQILQYLVNKQDKSEDPELMLNKLLTGLDPLAPIEKFQEITKEEKEMCDGLLDAIVKHWSALKSTTRDSMRASFFMRSGKLIYEEENWRLKVEQKSIDILIDKLPWSVSMIKLPWMEKSIVVEWR